MCIALIAQCSQIALICGMRIVLTSILRNVHCSQHAHCPHKQSAECALFSACALRNVQCSHKQFAECALFSTCALFSQAVCGMCIVLYMCIAECALFSQTVCGMCIVLNMRIVPIVRNVHCSHEQLESGRTLSDNIICASFSLLRQELNTPSFSC